MTESTLLAPPDRLLVRYGELALKKGNRGQFEAALVTNIKQALTGITPAVVERHFGRIVVIPERRAQEAAARTAEVMGIKSVSPAWRSAPTVEAMADIGRKLLEDGLARRASKTPVTFRVNVRRSDKSFPITSTDLERQIAERILPGPDQVKVQLSNPEMELGIEIRTDGVYVFLDRLPGPGGLPVGTLGRTLCLLSGGIDSPVAAWLAMKRGCRVAYISFHSAPFLGESSKRKIADLVRTLARYQGRSRLFVVPFADYQLAVRDNAPESYRTVLYRRGMQRIATRIARREGYGALITGESLGQVASQTLENMTCIGAVTDLPVLRPLVTYDKEEAITVARKIGTFDVSIRHEPDCCTVFQPSKPVIRGTLKGCDKAESKLDIDALVRAAVEGTEVVGIDPED
tara:strand:+ start:27748 stop:28956 length:1209 start_codon:yes stop_codon:yes gene_type:complete